MISERTQEELMYKLQARHPFVWVVSDEEESVRNSIAKKCISQKKEVWVWSCYSGLREFSRVQIARDDKTLTFIQALNEVVMKDIEAEKGAVFIFCDPGPHINPHAARQIKDVYNNIYHGDNEERIKNYSKNKEVQHGKPKNVIFISSSVSNAKGDGIEPTLKGLIDIIKVDLPNTEDIQVQLKALLLSMKEKTKGKETCKIKLDYTDEEIYRFARNLTGLTSFEISKTTTDCLVKYNQVNENALYQKKKDIIKSHDILELVDDNSTLSDIGGLDQLKEFIKDYAGQFTKAAKEFNVEPLRGILLVGLPGSGKSKSAKCLSKYWNVPCIRLDVGKVFSSLVGSSEERMRRTISVLKACIPCICWIDEIDKNLSGSSSSEKVDGGTMARVFGTFLTAMEEELKGVVIVATANNISHLPPELIRRFDEVFAVDLPNPIEREEIFSIHMNKRNKELTEIDVSQLVDLTEGYTGAEIEKIVKRAIIFAFKDGAEKVNQDHLLKAIEDIKPISKMMSEKITELRNWAKGRARYASTPYKKKPCAAQGIEGLPQIDDMLKN